MSSVTPPADPRPRGPNDAARVQRHVLPNGLVVLIEPLYHAPVVALQAWVGVGAADENKARAAGLAHLHEHMLFKGTARRGVGEVARTIEAQGGEMNAWTSFDETVYHLVLADSRVGLGIDLLADMLQAATFDENELTREKEVVLEEIRRAEDSPGRRMSAALFAAAYTQHGYKDPVLGSKESVRATHRADMVAFYREHYRPDNTTLVVVGSVQPAEVLRAVETHFGAWTKPEAAAPADAAGAGANADPASTAAPRRPEPPPTALRLKVLAEDVQEARVSLAWPGLRAQDADTAALDLFSVLLGSGDSSRLHQALVRPRHVRDAYASSYTPKDPGLLLVGATLQTARPNADEALEAIEQLVHEAVRLAERGVDAAELQKARTMVLSDAAYSKETMEGQARKRGFFELAAGSWTHEAAYTEAIAKLDGAAVAAVGRRLLAAPPVVVLQLPKDAPKDALGLAEREVEAAVARARHRGRRPAAKAAPATAATAEAWTPGNLGVVRRQLPDGPLLLVQPTAGEVVSLRVVAHGGQRGEERGSAGSALLLANCLGQATQHHAAEALAARIAAMGGGLSAFAGRNTVGLAADFVAGHAQAGLMLAYEALWAAKLNEADVTRERYAQLERIRSRSDSPGGVAMDEFLAALYPSHPYGLPALGFADTVGRLDVEALTALHAASFAPERTVLAICGPVDPAATFEQLAEALEAFGPGAPTTLQDALRRGKGAPTPALDAPPSARHRVARPLDKAQAHVVVGSHGARLSDADRYPLDVLAAALSGQSGRLFLDLRDRHSLAYALSCSSVEGCDPGHVAVHVGCSPSKVGQALDGVHRHLRQLAEAPLEAAELQRAQQVLVGGHAIDLQRAGARAMTLATGELYGMGYDSYATYPGHVMNVTAEAVMDVAKRYLHADRCVEVVVGPKGDAPAPSAAPATPAAAS